MSDEVRFGICGLGMGRSRAKYVTDTAGARLVAVCDVLEERGTEAAGEFGCEWIADYDELLARDDIDVVGIFTPSGTHAGFARRALEAGKHAFVTKPMDIRVAECDAAMAAAEARGLVLGVDFESRYNRVNHQIRAAIESGAIGDVVAATLLVRWYRSQQYYDGGSPPGWRSRRGTEGGSLANQAVHYLDLLQWWLGPVRLVFGKSGTFAHSIETEDASAGLIEFESGAAGLVFTSTSHFPDLGTTIDMSGTRGTISWKDQGLTRFAAVKEPEGAAGAGGIYQLPEHMAQPEVQDLCLDDFPAPENLPANIIEDMLGAIREGKPLQCGGHEGRKTVEILSAIYESSASSQPVVLGR